MNAGYGIGDVIAVSRLAWSVYKSCKDAPKDFRDISGEVSRLHIVLKETEDLISDFNEDLHPDKKIQLQGLAIGCHDVLTDLEDLIAKFKRLGTRSRTTFDRLRWSQDEVAALRVRIVSNTTLLSAFGTTIQMWIYLVY